MTLIDWLILAFALLFAFYGYRQGFIVGALSLAGFAVGAVVGTRVGPLILPRGAQSPYAPLFGLLGALLAGGILASGLENVAVVVRRRLTPGPLHVADGVLGGILTAAVALGIAWIAGAVALQTSQTRSLQADIQRSAVLRRLNAVLPPSGPILNALARFDPVPRIDGPTADVGPPSAAIARDPQVRAASRSVVRVLGTACGLGVEGSGWVAAPGVVVTNAHVIAGEKDTAVQVMGKGPKRGAQAIAFDPRNDVALLRVKGLDPPALPLTRDPRPGTSAAVLGFPENGPYDVEPGRVGQTTSVLTQDAYGQGPVQRSITSLRARVRSGNSGGPMVDSDGRVQTTVFAATRGGRFPGGFGVPNGVVLHALDHARGDVGTGPCAGP